MRIDKLLVNMGYGSRKEVKALLKSGSVKVNGETVKDPKVHVNAAEDSITASGEEVRYSEFIYLMMNKPAGVVSATEDNRDRTVVDLLRDEDRRFQPFPAGRLDKDTEGLLLLTNDGKLAHELLSPKKHVGKVYAVLVEGAVTEEDEEAFREGVLLDDGYKTKPAELEILISGQQSEVRLRITEGKFHQVKRMFQSRGKRVVHLKRLSMGSLELDPSLRPGRYRPLSAEEIAQLKAQSE